LLTVGKSECLTKGRLLSLRRSACRREPAQLQKKDGPGSAALARILAGKGNGSAVLS